MAARDMSGAKCKPGIVWLGIALWVMAPGCTALQFSRDWGGRMTDSLLWGPREERISASRQMARNGSDWAGRGQIPEAIEAFQQAIKIWPADVRNYLELALQYRRLDDHRSAILAVEQGLKYDQSNLELKMVLAQSYLALGQREMALQIVDEIVQAQRDSGAAWALRAKILFEMQRYEEALADVYQADALLDDDDEMLEMLCRIYFLLNRPNRAWSIVQRLNTRYPAGDRPSSVLALEAEALYQMNRKTEAVQALQQWYHEGGESDPLCCHLLTTYHQEVAAVQAEDPSAFGWSPLASRIPSTIHPGWGQAADDQRTPLATLFPMTERPKFRPLGSVEPTPTIVR